MSSTSFTRVTALSRWQTEVQDTAGTYATQSLGYTLLNEAMGDWCEMTRLRRINDQIDIVANTSNYSLSSLSVRCIEVIRASCPTSASATDDQILPVISIEEADRDYPNWRSDPASWPHSIIRDVQGPQSIRLYPTPSSNQEATVRNGTILANQTTGALMNLTGLTSAQATAAYGAVMNIQFLVGSLQLYYIGHSTDISADATTVETACGISPDFQDALIWYMTARFYEIDVPIAQRDKAPSYWEKWATEVAKASGLSRVGMQRRPSRLIPWGNV